jgi:Holliday junction resolvasome RuvABC endonuclease subunit
MRIVVGLDLSYTNTGIAIFKDGVFQELTSKTVATSPKMGIDVLRAHKILHEILTLLDDLALQHEDIKVFIEDYAYARLTNREKMGELGGVVKHGLWGRGYDFETLPISTIRKVVTGKGNATKDLVMMSLYKRYGLDIQQNDLADAAAVALTGDFVVQARGDAAAAAKFTQDVREAVKSYLKSK